MQDCVLVVSFKEVKEKLGQQIDQGNKFLEAYKSYSGEYQPFKEQVGRSMRR